MQRWYYAQSKGGIMHNQKVILRTIKRWYYAQSKVVLCTIKRWYYAQSKGDITHNQKVVLRTIKGGIMHIICRIITQQHVNIGNV